MGVFLLSKIAIKGARAVIVTYILCKGDEMAAVNRESFNEKEWVNLKPGSLPYVKIRKWYIIKIEKDKILLRCKEEKYTLEVSPEDIENSDPPK